MKNEVYNKLRKLNNVVVHSIHYDIHSIIDLLVINYINELLQSLYTLSNELLNKLIELIDKIKYYGDR